MKRAKLFFMIAAIGIFCFDIGRPGVAASVRAVAVEAAARGGGGFSHVPTASRAGRRRLPGREHFAAPLVQSAPLYHPGPARTYEPHVESYHPAYTARPSIERGAFVDRRAAVDDRAAVDRRMEGVRRPA